MAWAAVRPLPAPGVYVFRHRRLGDMSVPVRELGLFYGERLQLFLYDFIEPTEALPLLFF